MMKQQLRKELKSLRNQLSTAQVEAWSQKICTNILTAPQYSQADVIFGYLAFGNEPNIDAVLQQALLDGKTVCVPQILSATEICALQLSSFDDLQAGPYGIRSVGAGNVIAPQQLELVLVPGVGFAPNGSRLGMGAGYYDRFLAQAGNAVLLGVTYNALLRAELPVEPYDRPVQYIVTETNVTPCG